MEKQLDKTIKDFWIVVDTRTDTIFIDSIYRTKEISINNFLEKHRNDPDADWDEWEIIGYECINVDINFINSKK